MRLIGYNPHKAQRDVHNYITNAKKINSVVKHIVTVVSPRQCGKSLLIVNELLRHSINKPNSTNGCISPTIKQAKKLYRDCVKAISKAKIVKSANATTLTIDLINGSEIAFRSAEQREALRGYTYTGILCIDECSYISDDIISIILPSTNVHKPIILNVSTPRLKQGYFYECYLKGLSDDFPYYKTFDFTKYDLSRFLPKEQIEEYKHILPKNLFITEILGQFLSTDGMLFENINAAVTNEKAEITPYLFAGIDIGSGVEKDNTVFTILNSKCQIIEQVAFNDKNTTDTVITLTDIIKKYNKNNLFINVEINGVGRPIYDLLKKELPNHKLIAFTTTNQSKQRQVNELQVLLEQEQIKIPNDQNLINELSAFQATLNMKTNSISYSAPNGYHDDRVMSLLLAVDLYNSKKHNDLKYTFG